MMRRNFQMLGVVLLLLQGAAWGQSAPAAWVEGRALSHTQLLPSAEEQQRQRQLLAPEAYAKWLDTEVDQALLTTLLQPLLMRFAREQKLEPTRAELQAFTRSSERAVARVREELRADPAQADALATMEKEDAEVAQLRAADPAQAAEFDAFKAKLARGWVLSWKVQRALHRRYGGDVIFQQAGLEAVGALAPFLLEQERRGLWRIPDPALRERLLRHARELPGTRVPAEGLETPFWAE
jgi:hypothetical protein